METMMVALRWDGRRLNRQELMTKASKAANTVGKIYNHVNRLDINAIPDVDGQYVQLIVQTDAGASDADSMQARLKEEFCKS